MKKYLIVGGAVTLLFVLAVVFGKMFLNHFEKSIRQGERKIIALELEKQKVEKEGRVKEDVAEKKAIIDNASDSELADYFRTGRLPKRPAGDKDRPATNPVRTP